MTVVVSTGWKWHHKISSLSLLDLGKKWKMAIKFRVDDRHTTQCKNNTIITVALNVFVSFVRPLMDMLITLIIFVPFSTYSNVTHFQTIYMNAFLTVEVVVRCILIVCWIVWILRCAPHRGLELLVLTSTLSVMADFSLSVWSRTRMKTACSRGCCSSVSAEHGVAAVCAPVFYSSRGSSRL